MSRNSQNQIPVRETLELYLARHSEILDTRLIRSGYNPSFTLNWNYLEGMKIGGSEPNQDDLRSFLTIYRKFISQESPFFINKIFNLCQQHLLSEQMKNDLVGVRSKWSNELKYGFMGLKIDGRDLSPGFLCDLWINAVYFGNNILDAPESVYYDIIQTKRGCIK